METYERAEMTTNLSGRHALVTGGGRGIGAAIARILIEHGANVTLLGRDKTQLSATALELGAGACAVVADVADRSAVALAFAEARAKFGDVDILVNNAGQVVTAPLVKTDAQVFDQMIATNLTGTYHCVHEVLPGMIGRNFGRIVNIASTAGLVGYSYCVAYCAAKHGVIGLTRALALEVATRNITVNAVCPGFTDTDIVRHAVENIQQRTGRTAEQAVAAIVEHNPQRRLITPGEVANAVAWLCLPGTESMTGQSISVAGGEVM